MSLIRSKAVLELGKRLVAQLSAGDDLLSSWMAHDIAGRIEAAEKAPPKDKAAAKDACAKAILKLWRYRNALPHHLRPLGEIEPVRRTLASLDVDRTDHRYYADALREAVIADVDENTKRWLKCALDVDYTARLLIQFALRSAADHAASDAERWVELAREAGAEEGIERLVVRFIVGEDEASESDENRKDAALREKVSRLESFAKAASSLAADLRNQLARNETEEPE